MPGKKETKQNIELPSKVPSDESNGAENQNDEALSTVEELPFDVKVGLSLSDKVLEAMARTNTERLAAKFYVSRFINGDTRGLKESCGKKIIYPGDEIPDEDDIGLAYGSGVYLCQLSVPAGKNQPVKYNSWLVRCSAVYDDLKAKALPGQSKLSAVTQVQPVQPVQPVQTIVDPMEQFRQMVLLFKEIMPKPEKADRDRIAETMAENYKMIGEVLRKSFIDNVNVMNQLAAKQINATLEEPEEIDDEPAPGSPGTAQAPEWLQQLAPLLPFAKALLDTLSANKELNPTIQAAAQLGKQYIDQTITRASNPLPENQQVGDK